MRTIEWALLGLFCLIVLYLQIVLYRHAGAFWRDETSSIQVASSPSFASMWSSLSIDSFPGLFVSLLRLWILAGLGATNDGIRLFGTLIALGIVASVLASFSVLTRSVPLAAVSLIAMNGTIFYFGSSIRAYGLAVLLIVPCFAAFWKVVQSPTRLNTLAALVLALLAVHCNYQNCYLLFGIGVAGAGVCAICRLWTRSLLVLTICFIAALTMLVYLPAINKYHEVMMIQPVVEDWSPIYKTLAASLAGSNSLLLFVWGIVLLSALFILPYRYYQERRSQTGNQRPSLYLFSLIAIVTGIASGTIFFRVNHMFPYVWQFTPFVAFAAVVVEIGIHCPKSTVRFSAGKAALACLIVGISIFPLWKSAHLRRTNFDLVSDVVSREARSDDLIIVNPFWLISGFNFHYHGKAEWNTLPMIPSDHASRLAPYKHIKQLMATTGAIEPTLDKIGKTLKNGNRLWIVGWIQFPPPNSALPKLPPAPQSVFGWNHNAYTQVWSMQLGRFLQDHATQGRQFSIPVEQPVNELENVSLFFVEGWR